MPAAPQVVYTFGEFQLRPAEKQLLRDGQPVPLTPKVFDTLLLLVESQGRLIEKEAFLKRIWPDSFVEEVALAHGISQLRKALGEGIGGSKFIETVPKRGYRFIAAVEVLGPETAEPPSGITLAVLPFENLDAGSERDYLADGLTEEVIASLGQVDPEDLRVIGRTSMMAYKRTTKSLADIGRELKAGFLVESSIRGEGSRLRITSRLVRVSDQSQMWSESYDSEPGSVLELQRELSTVIARKIRQRLSPERVNALERRQTHDAEAFHLYLRGRYYFHQLSAATTRRAVEYYMQATQLDPAYALAWAGLADAYSANPINGDGDPRRIGPLARQAEAHAVQAEPALAEVQCGSGFVKFWLDWDWLTAEKCFRAAIARDPSYALAHRTLAVMLSHMGRHGEAAEAAKQALQLDPLHAGHYALSAQVAYNAGDYAGAVKLARRATVIDPEFWVGHLQLGQALAAANDGAMALDALSALQNAWRFSGSNSKAISYRGNLLARMGRIAEAEEVLRILEAAARERYVPPYSMALVHMGLGRVDLAVEWLERAWEVRDVHLAFIPIDPRWDGLRSDPRFGEVLERCGFLTGGPATAARHSVRD